VIPGLLGAFAAAVLYGAATVLQAVGVRRAAADPDGTALKRLWRARLYVVGLALDALGFLASIVALRTLPLFVVESAIASSVAVTAVLAVVFLGTRLARREVLALVAVGVGLVALAVSATEGKATALHGPGGWIVLGLTVPVLALTVVAVRLPGPRAALLLAVAAGLGFGGVGVAARVLVTTTPPWRMILDPELWALVAYAAVALVAFGMALQRGSVTTTAAITFTVETVIPAAIGLIWLGDKVRPGFVPWAVVGFVCTLLGCIGLARHAAEE
jgi:drug/metabolite transporter (DMT)-like permease